MSRFFCAPAGEDLYLTRCCVCRVPFALTMAMYGVAMERRDEFPFHCPNGHVQHFARGETELARMTRERDRLKQQLAQRDDAIRDERQKRLSVERTVASLKKRAANGTCPCCHRSFLNLKRHMASKHPTFLEEAA